MTRHYLDHASTTRLRPEAAQAMAEAVGRLAAGEAGDPARLHAEGRLVREAVEAARAQVASFLGVRPRQVVFTAGATEAANTAIFGAVARAIGDPVGAKAAGTGPPPRTATSPPVVVCAAVEHSCVRDPSRRWGALREPTVDAEGRIDPGSVVASLDDLARTPVGRTPVGRTPVGRGHVAPSPSTIAEDPAAAGGPLALVNCQWANHEVGTIQPVAEIVAACRGHSIPVHVDAAAAAGHVPMDLGALDADFVSVSSHKLGGPPGAGALVIRRGLRVDPLVIGGDQERGRRAGMENVVGIVGFGAAAAAIEHRGVGGEAEVARKQTERAVAAALAVGGVRTFGASDDRLPHVVCLGINDVEPEAVLLGLDQEGVAVHSGSACSSEALEPSPVLAAMGADADHSLRVSVGWSTTDADVDAFCAAFARVVGRLRALAG